MNLSLWFFIPEHKYMELEWMAVKHQGANEAGGHTQGGRRAPHARGQGVGPLALILLPIFFIYSKNILH